MKKSRLQEAKRMLQEKGYKIVALNGEDTLTSEKQGIAALIEALNTYRLFLREATVADKVVGKAAALLMIFGEVKEVYAEIISQPALACFEKYGIPVEYEQCVERIENREKTGLCPMETLCIEIDNPVGAYRVLTDKFRNHNK